MCVVSFVGDHYRDKWTTPIYEPVFTNWPQVSKEEFDALRNEVLEMKELLKKAIKYDEENNEPHCEMEEKIEVLRKVAELVGVDLNELNLNNKDSSPTGTTLTLTQ